MKRWMKILCVLTVLVCVVWGAVSYFHYNTVQYGSDAAESGGTGGLHEQPGIVVQPQSYGAWLHG